MSLLKEDAHVNGAVAGNGGTLIVQHTGDWRSAVLPWKVGSTKLTIADSAFAVSGTTYPAGTYIVDNGASVRDAMTQLVAVEEHQAARRNLHRAGLIRHVRIARMQFVIEPA